MQKGNKINHDGSDIEILLMQVRWNFREKQDAEIGISYDYDYVNTPIADHDNIRNAGIPDKVMQAYIDSDNDQLAVVKEVIRKPIHDELLKDEVPEELLDKVYLLYKDWKAGEVLDINDIRRYNGELWRIDQAHTTQSNWLPGEAHSLYTRIRKEGIVEWKQPISGLDEPYMMGDKVTYLGDTWENQQDNNYYAPGVFGWVNISEGEPSGPGDDLCATTADWISTDHWTTYTVGDKRKNGGKIWEVHNVGLSYYEPSGPNGHYGWTFVQNCP